MSTLSSTQFELTLVAVMGPEPVSMTLDPARVYTIGRRSGHTIPLLHPEVSKDHASLAYHADAGRGSWFIADLHSRHGTRLNGVALEPRRECPVMPGDLISIEPWTFCLMDQRKVAGDGSRLRTLDDSSGAGSTVASIQAGSGGGELAQERLRLLLQCAESLQRAGTVDELAQIVLDAAIAGTGFPNAAVVRPMTPDGAVELIVGRGAIANDGNKPRLSRSLLRAASHGVPAQLMGSGMTGSVRDAASIAEFGIQEAICVPLMMETTVAGFLYLDNRLRKREKGNVAAGEACAYAIGIGRLASMAWANLMRLALERRYAFMEGELAAAADMQKTILPRREGRCGALSYIGECRPGRVVSGDFFDVIKLSDDRIALAVGDVSGKGIAASVLMTTAVGVLNGALRRSGDAFPPSAAISELACYVHERNTRGRFLTLWLGVFDTKNQTLTYVDAGHGYAYLLDAKQTLVKLNECGGAPVGAVPDMAYAPATIALPPGGRVIVVSDGIIEQPAAGDDKRNAFGQTRLETIVKGGDEHDDVAVLFDAVQEHAGATQLADDATVVVVRW